MKKTTIDLCQSTKELYPTKITVKKMESLLSYMITKYPELKGCELVKAGKGIFCIGRKGSDGELTIATGLMTKTEVMAYFRGYSAAKRDLYKMD